MKNLSDLATKNPNTKVDVKAAIKELKKTTDQLRKELEKRDTIPKSEKLRESGKTREMGTQINMTNQNEENKNKRNRKDLGQRNKL